MSDFIENFGQKGFRKEIEKRLIKEEKTEFEIKKEGSVFMKNAVGSLMWTDE